MKEISYSKTFKKRYKERVFGNKNLKKRVAYRINLFKIDPTPEILKDHPLTGKYKYSRSFSISGDVRVIYQVRTFKDRIVFIIVDIGTHNQVYE